jgi:entericidin B
LTRCTRIRDSVVLERAIPGRFIKKGQVDMRFLLIGCALFALAGCNTIEGVGRDVEAAGDAVSDAASGTKDKLTGDER